MNIWLCTLGLPEREFWRTATPCRVHALLKARARHYGQRPAPKEPEQPKSLAEYFMGG